MPGSQRRPGGPGGTHGLEVPVAAGAGHRDRRRARMGPVPTCGPPGARPTLTEYSGTPLPRHGSRILGRIALVWGTAGFLAVLAYAVARLGPLALDSFRYDWSPLQTLVFSLNVGFMAWVEGYKGFQRSYAPRLAARAVCLSRGATPLQAALAPLVCMGFLYAPRRRWISAWLLTAGIVAIVLVYRQLPQPWRGILDAGVVVGLAWGFVATVLAVRRGLRQGPAVDPELR